MKLQKRVFRRKNREKHWKYTGFASTTSYKVCYVTEKTRIIDIKISQNSQKTLNSKLLLNIEFLTQLFDRDIN